MVDPRRLMAAVSKLKGDKEYEDEIVNTCGIQGSLLAIYLISTRNFQAAMTQNVQDRDMLSVSVSFITGLALTRSTSVGHQDVLFSDEFGMGYRRWRIRRRKRPDND